MHKSAHQVFRNGPISKKIFTAFMVAGMLTAVTTSTASISSAAPVVTSLDERSVLDPTSATVPEIMAAQVELNDITHRVEEIAAEQGESSGFASTVMDIPTRSVTVYWKGDPGPAVDAVIRDGQARGIDAKVLPAAYTQAEMIAAALVLLGSGSDAETVDQRGGFKVHGAGPTADGSGVQARIEAWGRPADAGLLERARVALQPRTPVTVKVEVAPPVTGGALG